MLAGFPAQAEKGDWRASFYFQESALSPSFVTRTDHPEVWLWGNTGMKPGFEIRYRNFGFGIVPAFSGTMQDSPKHPPTRFEDYSLFYFGSAWGGEGLYHRYRGYYSEPPSGSDEILHSGMVADALVFNAYYAPLQRWLPDGHVRNLRDGFPLREDYHRGIYSTPLLFASASRHRMDADKPFLDGLSGEENSDFYGMRHAETVSFTVGAMAVINTEFHGLYFDPSVGFGTGYQKNDGDQIAAEDDWGSKWLIQFRTGYYRTWFDLGIIMKIDETVWHLNPDEKLMYDSFYARLYLELFF